MADDATLKIGGDAKGAKAAAAEAGEAVSLFGEKVKRENGLLESSFAKLTSSFTAASLIERGINVLTSWGAAALKSAGDTLDLSEKTGLSTTTIQQMAFAAKVAEVDVNGLGGAAQALFVRLERGTQKTRETVDGFTELGMTYKELVRLSPDQQFNKVIEALERMQDPQERSRMAYDLLGGKADVVLRVIAEGWTKLKDQAVVSSKEQLKAANDASEAFDRYVAQAEGYFKRLVVLPFQMAGALKDTLHQIYEGTKDAVSSVTSWGGSLVQGASGLNIFRQAVFSASAAVAGVTEQQVRAKPALETYADQAKKVAAEVAKLTSELRREIEAGIQLGKSNDDITARYDITAEAVDVLRKGLEKKTEAEKKAAEQIKKAHQVLQDYNEEIDKQNAAWRRGMATLADFTKEIEKHTDRVTQATIANALAQKKAELDKDAFTRERTLTSVQFQIDQINRAAANEKLALDKSVANWQKAAAAIDAAAAAKVKALVDDEALRQLVLFSNLNTDAAKRLRETNEAAKTAAYDGLASFFTSLGQIAGERGIGAVLSDLGRVAIGFKSANDQANQLGKDGQKLGGELGSLSTIFNDNATGSQKFAAALHSAAVIAQGVMDLWRKTGDAATAAQGQMVGLMEGAKAGSAFGTWGAVIGGAVGSLVGLERGARNARAASAELDRQIGSLQAKLSSLIPVGVDAEEMLNLFGLTLDGVFQPSREATLHNLNVLIAEFERRIAAAKDELSGLEGELSSVLDHAKGLGYEFDEQGNLVSVSFEKMKELAEKYGISLEALGESFQRARLHDAALEIINDFTLLSKGGTDTGTILLGMKDKINALVNDSIKFGTTIPANMRPWIQSLIDAGQLTDENGNKITDLSQIKFGDPVKSEFEKITDTLKELIAKITELVDKIAGIGRAVDDATRPRIIRIGWEIDDPPDIPDVPGGVRLAKGGLVNRPTRALVGEGGEPELVGPVSFMTDALTGAIQRVASIHAAVRGHGGPLMAGGASHVSSFSLVVDARGARFTDPDDIGDLAAKVRVEIEDFYKTQVTIGVAT